MYGTRPIGLRRLWALVFWLPADSAYARSLAAMPKPKRKATSADIRAMFGSHLKVVK